MLELVAELEPARVIGVSVKVCEHLIHAAELGRQHFLDLIVVEIGENALCPCGELDFDIQRRLVSREVVRIAQPGKELVLYIPRRPQAVQVEASRSDLTLAQILEANLAIHTLRILQRADVAVLLRVLNLLQLRNHIVGALFEAHVTRSRIHHADRGEIVTRDVSGELPPSSIPTAVPLRLRVETCALAKIGEHAGRLKLQQVRSIEILRLLQRATCQPHSVHRQRNSLEWNLVRSRVRVRACKRLQKGAENECLNTETSHRASRGEMNTK